MDEAGRCARRRPRCRRAGRRAPGLGAARRGPRTCGRVWHGVASRSWSATGRARPPIPRLAYDIFDPDHRRPRPRARAATRTAPRRDPARRGTCAGRCSTTWPRPATRWWFAEDEATGEAIGYARSILRDGVRELTEFFVLPEAQGAGVGRGLLARAFPADGARHRAIVATMDPRAIARYLADRARRPRRRWRSSRRRRGRPPRDRPRARADGPGGAAVGRAGRHRPRRPRLPSRRRPCLAGRSAVGLAVSSAAAATVGLRLPPDRAVVGRPVRRARCGRPAGPPGRRRDGRRGGRPDDGRRSTWR